MTARLATADDAAFMRLLYEEFLDDTSIDGQAPTTEGRARRIAARNIISVVDVDAGHACEIKVDERNRLCKVELLFPRGPNVEVLRPILSRALDETLLAFPGAREWRLWASFFGTDDGGLTACEAWAAAAPGAKVIGDKNGAAIEGLLGEVADGLRR